MKELFSLLGTVLVPIVVAVAPSFGQGTFQNLDFEAAAVSQAQPPGLVSASEALPGWAVYISTNQQTQVGFNYPAIGSTWVSLLGSNGVPGLPGYRSIEGGFSVLFQGGVIAAPGGGLYPAPSSLRQTGLVPVGSQSIQFKAQPDIVGTFKVSLDGVIIPFFAVSSLSGYTAYGGDVSAFGGRTVELEFALSGGPGSEYSIWNFDSIQFSTSVVPEPSVLALTALGAFLIAVRRLKLRDCELGKD